MYNLNLDWQLSSPLDRTRISQELTNENSDRKIVPYGSLQSNGWVLPDGEYHQSEHLDLILEHINELGEDLLPKINQANKIEDDELLQELFQQLFQRAYAQGWIRVVGGFAGGGEIAFFLQNFTRRAKAIIEELLLQNQESNNRILRIEDNSSIPPKNIFYGSINEFFEFDKYSSLKLDWQMTLTEDDFWDYINQLHYDIQKIPQVVPKEYAIEFWKMFFSFTDKLVNRLPVAVDRTFIVGAGKRIYEDYVTTEASGNSSILTTVGKTYAKEFTKALRDYALNSKESSLKLNWAASLKLAAPDPNPSEEQIEAGNYKKDHVRKDGLDITIENKKGSTRSGTDKDGKEWSVTMKHDYGYIKGTVGKDKDHVDVTLADDYKEGQSVFIVNQTDDKGNFDEHKCMLGFTGRDEAEKAYLDNYEKGWNNYNDIIEMPMDQFKEWVMDKKHTKKEAEPLKLDWANIPNFRLISPQEWSRIYKKVGSMDVFIIGLQGDTVDKVKTYLQKIGNPTIAFLYIFEANEEYFLVTVFDDYIKITTNHNQADDKLSEEFLKWLGVFDNTKLDWNLGPHDIEGWLVSCKSFPVVFPFGVVTKVTETADYIWLTAIWSATAREAKLDFLSRAYQESLKKIPKEQFNKLVEKISYVGLDKDSSLKLGISLPKGEQYENHHNTLDLSYPSKFINLNDKEYNNMSKGKEVDSETLKLDKKNPELFFEKGLHTQEQVNNNDTRRITPFGSLYKKADARFWLSPTGQEINAGVSQGDHNGGLFELIPTYAPQYNNIDKTDQEVVTQIQDYFYKNGWIRGSIVDGDLLISLWQLNRKSLAIIEDFLVSHNLGKNTYILIHAESTSQTVFEGTVEEFFNHDAYASLKLNWKQIPEFKIGDKVKIHPFPSIVDTTLEEIRYDDDTRLEMEAFEVSMDDLRIRLQNAVEELEGLEGNIYNIDTTPEGDNIYKIDSATAKRFDLRLFGYSFDSFYQGELELIEKAPLKLDWQTFPEFEAGDRVRFKGTPEEMSKEADEILERLSPNYNPADAKQDIINMLNNRTFIVERADEQYVYVKCRLLGNSFTWPFYPDQIKKVGRGSGLNWKLGKSQEKPIFICLWTPDSVREKLSNIKDLEDDLHVTLVYRPKAKQTYEKNQELLKEISKIAKEYKKIKVKFGGTASFDNPDKSSVALVNIKEAPQLFTKLVEAIEKIYGEWDREFGLTTHMTIHSKGNGKIPEVKPFSWTANYIGITFGSTKDYEPENGTESYLISFGNGEIETTMKKKARGVKLGWQVIPLGKDAVGEDVYKGDEVEYIRDFEGSYAYGTVVVKKGDRGIVIDKDSDLSGGLFFRVKFHNTSVPSAVIPNYDLSLYPDAWAVRNNEVKKVLPKLSWIITPDFSKGDKVRLTDAAKKELSAHGKDFQNAIFTIADIKPGEFIKIIFHNEAQ
ncbi:MAG: 2'-5' RNA ligase family protein, partial [Novosphingobium sp.]|nr:2'-5' RNA ligase family protein [Novosphingobium sp.]